MKINLLQAISCGNAVRMIVTPDAGETRWRVLRNETGAFTGADDSSAFLVHDGTDRFLTDARLLVNGVAYSYAVYGWLGASWSSPVILAVTPHQTFTDASTDVQELVRERLDATLAGMMQRGLVTLGVASVPVMSIPFYQQGGSLPVVTVLYGGGSAVAHGLGGSMAGDEPAETGWLGYQGWHQSVTLEISAWSLNAQERNAIRQALQAAITANIDIWETQGLNMVEVQAIQDSEDFQSMNVPLYQTVFRLGCQTVVAVANDFGSIDDVTVYLGD